MLLFPFFCCLFCRSSAPAVPALPIPSKGVHSGDRCCESPPESRPWEPPYQRTAPCDLDLELRLRARPSYVCTLEVPWGNPSLVGDLGDSQPEAPRFASIQWEEQ